MSQDPNDPTFGFDDEPKPTDEKYNTRFLVANLQREKNVTKFIIIGIGGAALLSLILWLVLAEPSKPEPPKLLTPEAAIEAGAGKAAVGEAKAPEAKSPE